MYLENSLTAHVFTSERITVLKLLAAQAAISLENTQLYADLEIREAKIRRLVDANIMAVVIWRLDGAIVESNEAFLRMVQYDREDVATARVRWTDLTPTEWREHDERALAEIRATGTVQPYEKELFRKDGSRVPVLVAGTLFEGGGSEGVAFAFDLSEQKQQEAERERLRQELTPSRPSEPSQHDGRADSFLGPRNQATDWGGRYKRSGVPTVSRPQSARCGRGTRGCFGNGYRR